MRPVIIDTDPGTDDAIAIAMALSSPDLKVLGVTTVGGNALRLWVAMIPGAVMGAVFR